MFKRILIALDHSKADDALLPRVKELARLTKAELLLIHVSTGWAARWQKDLDLSDSDEIREDRAYLDFREKQIREEGFAVRVCHATGEPASEILRVGREEHCDLIAMTTHGHRLLSDVIHGTTITRVRHEAEIPIFLVKASPD
jgi:manganese transport protein